jgi:hypothetical protein
VYRAKQAVKIALTGNQVAGKRNYNYHLGKFRRLQVEKPQAYPALSAAGIPPKVQYGPKEQQIKNIKVWGKAVKLGVISCYHDQHNGKSNYEQHRLAPDKIVGIAGYVNYGGTADYYQADQHDGADCGQHNKVKITEVPFVKQNSASPN